MASYTNGTKWEKCWLFLSCLWWAPPSSPLSSYWLEIMFLEGSFYQNSNPTSKTLPRLFLWPVVAGSQSSEQLRESPDQAGRGYRHDPPTSGHSVLAPSLFASPPNYSGVIGALAKGLSNKQDQGAWSGHGSIKPSGKAPAKKHRPLWLCLQSLFWLLQALSQHLARGSSGFNPSMS